MTRTEALQFGIVVAFAAVAVALAALARIPLAGAIARAAGRATVQLLAVGALLTLLVDRPWIAVAFAGVMITTATFTAAGRVGVRSVWPWLAIAIALPAGGAAAAILLSGALPGGALTAVATIGILVGGAMTTASLTGRALVRELSRDLPRVETLLCLGATVREACAEPVRHAVVGGLVPALDQTRTVGLIALPGTFVGLVLGGASPATAARVQLLVLVGLIAVELAAALIAAHAIVLRLTVRGAERLQLPEPDGQAAAPRSGRGARPRTN